MKQNSKRTALGRVQIFQEVLDGSIETEIWHNNVPMLYLGIEQDFYSAYWESPMTTSEFVLFAENQMSVPPEARCRISTELYTDRLHSDRRIYSFQEVVNQQATNVGDFDKESTFLRIDGILDLTWHVDVDNVGHRGPAVVGVISAKLDIDELRS